MLAKFCSQIFLTWLSIRLVYLLVTLKLESQSFFPLPLFSFSGFPFLCHLQKKKTLTFLLLVLSFIPLIFCCCYLTCKPLLTLVIALSRYPYVGYFLHQKTFFKKYIVCLSVCLCLPACLPTHPPINLI